MRRSLVLIALLLGALAILAMPTQAIIEPQITRVTEPIHYYGVPPGHYKKHGPHYGVLQVAPYLDSTNPAGKVVCVGYLDANTNQGSCDTVVGSGPGAYSPAGDMYDVWLNGDYVTIDIHGHTTITMN